MRSNVLMLFFAALLSHLSAQDCSSFYSFEEGTVIEYAFFDKKGKLTSIGKHLVTVVDDLEDGGIEAQVETQVMDEEGEIVTESHYKVRCRNNIFYVDLTSRLAPEMTQSFAHMDITMTGDALEIPSDLRVGQSLPDASNVIEAGTNGLNILKMTFDVTDRQVVAQETVETDAGSFNCLKITHTMHMKMMVRKSFSVVEWFARGIGVVKSETYNKKGKLEGSMEVRRVEKI